MFGYARVHERERPDPEELSLSGSEEVPEGWRRLVEEHHRSLARDGS